MNPYIGEIAALLAAAGFSFTSVCYTFAGRKINAVTSIAMSLPLAWVSMLGIHYAAQGALFPWQTALDRWLLLGASGILAFVISSYCMLNAYQAIGPRLTMLIASCAPLLGALLAWLFLGQTLPANAALGIAIVTGGVVWVVVERSPRRSPQRSPQRRDPNHRQSNESDALSRTQLPHFDLRRGAIFAVLGTLAQALAFVFSSQGVAGDFPPLSATLIRITAGIVALWLFIAWQGKLRATAAIFTRDIRLFWQLTGAAISGPVLAGSLVLLALQTIPVGIATTLSHTTAIMLIPVSYFVFKEQTSLRAVLGTLVALVGIFILFN
ncbi:MAG: DMT family transporter [Litorilinea sp.]